MGIRLTSAFIFDFDGTLVDSEQAIYQCFQSITKQLAPERLKYSKNILIGPPLRDTASEILGPDHQNSLDEFVRIFIKMHDEEVINHTKPYSGVNKFLQILHKKKIPMAIATNKREVPTKKLIEHFGWQDYFKNIECSDSKEQLRDKGKMIKDIIYQDERFAKGFFVGDTPNDGKFANIHNLLFVKANYGYGNHQNWSKIIVYKTINTPEELFFIS